jgi:hypothetical protein
MYLEYTSLKQGFLRRGMPNIHTCGWEARLYSSAQSERDKLSMRCAHAYIASLYDAGIPYVDIFGSSGCRIQNIIRHSYDKSMGSPGNFFHGIRRTVYGGGVQGLDSMRRRFTRMKAIQEQHQNSNHYRRNTCWTHRRATTDDPHSDFVRDGSGGGDTKQCTRRAKILATSFPQHCCGIVIRIRCLQ